MLQRLYDILFEFREYAILAGLVACALILLALNNNPQLQRVRAVTSVVFGVVQEQVSFIPSYFSLRAENQLLRRMNVDLADEAYRLREAKLENLRLHALLGLKDRVTHRLIAGTVVGKNLTLLRNTLTLDIGSREGVEERMPVVTDAGLVGLVVAVSPHYSVVNILLNTDFRASAKVQRSRVDGIVAWDGQSLILKNVPKSRDVKPGDVVITSEYSDMFPDDVRIGVVNDVRDQPSSMFKSVTITPSVDFVRLEEVFVVEYRSDAERQLLEQKASAGVR